ncbi:MAG TPA: hypothetical protein VEB66_06175 [Opitutaceae bacterium]|nr:hypothetical protein [Opitutaceae bacterium]
MTAPARAEVWFWPAAAAIAAAWLSWHIGWLPGHTLNAMRWTFYDQGSYLYALGCWQSGEVLYRDIHWQYGPLALGWYRAFAAVLGNTPVALATGSAVALGAAWMLFARLMWRTGGAWGATLAVAGLLPAMTPPLLLSINIGPHGAIEALLVAVAATILPGSAASRARQLALGAVAALLQWVRFGPHLVLIGAVGIVWLGEALAARDGVRAAIIQTLRRAVPLLLAYAAGVLPLAAWYWLRLPPGGAAEVFWPAFMLGHYRSSYGAEDRWPSAGTAFEFAITWLPALAAVAASVAMLGRARQRDGLPAGLLLATGYLVLGVLVLHRTRYAVLAHFWLAWPALAWAGRESRHWRFAGAVLLAPILWHHAAGAWRTAREEKAWAAQPRVMPNGQALWMRPRDEEKLVRLAAEVGRIGAGRPVAVMVSGGGVHHFFGTRREGRHWWWYPGFVRPWERARAERDLLAHGHVLVVTAMQPDQPSAPGGALQLALPLTDDQTAALLPRLRNPRTIPGVGHLIEIAPGSEK